MISNYILYLPTIDFSIEGEISYFLQVSKLYQHHLFNNYFSTNLRFSQILFLLGNKQKHFERKSKLKHWSHLFGWEYPIAENDGINVRSYLLSWTLLMKMIFHLWIQRQALHRGSKNQILQRGLKWTCLADPLTPKANTFLPEANPVLFTVLFLRIWQGVRYQFLEMIDFFPSLVLQIVIMIMLYLILLPALFSYIHRVNSYSAVKS